MTDREAFEALLEKARDEEHLLSRYEVWKAACAWQREKDAEITTKTVLDLDWEGEREAMHGGRWAMMCIIEAIRNQGDE